MKNIAKTISFFFIIALLSTITLQGEIVSMTSSNVDSLIKNNKGTVVKVYADWCGPCKTITPIYDSVAKQYGSNYTFATLDAGADKALITRFNVTGLPTILFFKDGKEVSRKVGLVTEASLKETIQNSFGK